jgi:hypothetical protein
MRAYVVRVFLLMRIEGKGTSSGHLPGCDGITESSTGGEMAASVVRSGLTKYHVLASAR